MPYIISIEGNIGSGKSTFLTYLKKYINDVSISGNSNIQFIQEPVDEWNEIKDSNGESILEKFYNNQKEYAFSFQIMAYITRLRKLLQHIENNPNDIFICERSLETDKYVFAKMLYDNKKIREIDWNIYNYWFDTFLKKVQTNIIVYIQTSPGNCHKRVELRNRKGEHNISLDYLTMCHTYHEQWLEKSSITVININGNVHKDNTSEYESILNSIVNMIPQFVNT